MAMLNDQMVAILGPPRFRTLQDPDSSVREAAAKALGCLGHDGLRAMDGEDVQVPRSFFPGQITTFLSGEWWIYMTDWW